MKRFKNAFTLAEVLITLAIIGIVAAIVMPSVISSYQYKTLGVKLSKFASTVENSARAYAVSNGAFSRPTAAGAAQDNADINFLTFANESFIIKSIQNGECDLEKLYAYYDIAEDDRGDVTCENYPNFLTMDYTVGSGDDAVNHAPVAFLKDNTRVSLRVATDNESNYEENHSGVVGDAKVGRVFYVIDFEPNVSGLPSTVQQHYTFGLTEMGFLYPAANDQCLWNIYDADWVTSDRTFRTGGACDTTAP